MFKKTLLCAISALIIAPLSARAGELYPYQGGHSGIYAHRTRVRGTMRHARPLVIKGYYAGNFRPEHHGYHYGARSYFPPQAYAGFASTPTESYNQPVLAYSQATAYVPVTTYAPVPVRIYYIPQQQPYYNVPPYAVRAAGCMCD